MTFLTEPPLTFDLQDVESLWAGIAQPENDIPYLMAEVVLKNGEEHEARLDLFLECVVQRVQWLEGECRSFAERIKALEKGKG